MSATVGSNQGSTWGGMMLVTGCCIGAGMLGLPIVTIPAGFIPSCLTMLVACIFMISTGLLVLESNLWFDEEVSLISVTRLVLGKPGEAVTWVMFLFLLYCLLTAYIAASGELIAQFFDSVLSIEISAASGGIICILLMGGGIYFGTGAVDRFNRFLMAGLVVSYCLLISVGVKHVDHNALRHQQWLATFSSLPIMIVSFGYHNLVPSIATYLGKNCRKIVKTILFGSFFSLIVYLVWEYIVLGMMPENGMLDEYVKNHDFITNLLSQNRENVSVIAFINCFSFFAITTSLVGSSLSLVDFIADGLQMVKTNRNKIFLIALALLPPFFVTITYPHLFLEALGLAGGVAAVVLFGILPALNVWIGRYQLGRRQAAILPGGRPVLILVILFAIFVVGVELSKQFQ